MAFWKAKTKDGREISELDGIKWTDVKDNIAELIMATNDGKFIFLPKNMEQYTQFKTASSNLSGNNIEIESRVIGCKVGNIMVKIRVNEKTNNINVETE
jgi:hypothetical protein